VFGVLNLQLSYLLTTTIAVPGKKVADGSINATDAVINNVVMNLISFFDLMSTLTTSDWFLWLLTL